jgi:hypothetical protein
VPGIAPYLNRFLITAPLRARIRPAEPLGASDCLQADDPVVRTLMTRTPVGGRCRGDGQPLTNGRDVPQA